MPLTVAASLDDREIPRFAPTPPARRVRGEIARGEFDAAVQTLQTMFALARTFNEHPTLIATFRRLVSPR